MVTLRRLLEILPYNQSTQCGYTANYVCAALVKEWSPQKLSSFENIRGHEWYDQRWITVRHHRYPTDEDVKEMSLRLKQGHILNVGIILGNLQHHFVLVKTTGNEDIFFNGKVFCVDSYINHRKTTIKMHNPLESLSLFAEYKNDFGALLKGWNKIFDCDERMFTQDVGYPTQFEYAYLKYPIGDPRGDNFVGSHYNDGVFVILRTKQAEDKKTLACYNDYYWDVSYCFTGRVISAMLKDQESGRINGKRYSQLLF